MATAIDDLTMDLKDVSLDDALQVRGDDESIIRLEDTAAATAVRGEQQREPCAMGLVDMAGEVLR